MARQLPAKQFQVGSTPTGVLINKEGIMPIDERWLKCGPDDLRWLAQAWLSELGSEDAEEGRAGDSVTMMGFTAPPDVLWQFLLIVVECAESDDELGHIAAGPVEYLLGKHGESYIDKVEEQANRDQKFARTLTGAWKYLMTDEVWNRLRRIQKQIPDPLPEAKP
jgi:hypothetical protein